jgi:hypothetical protein
LERRPVVLHTSSGRLGTPPLRSPHFQRAAWNAASTFSTLPAGGLKSRLYVLSPACRRLEKPPRRSILPAGGLKSRLYVLHTSSGRLGKPPLRATSCPQVAWNAASTFSTLPAGGLERRPVVLHTSSGRLGKPPLRSISCPQAAWQAARKREAKGVTLAG